MYWIQIPRQTPDSYFKKTFIVSFVFEPKIKLHFQSVYGNCTASREKTYKDKRTMAKLRQFMGLDAHTTATSQSIHEQQVVDNGHVTTQTADTVYAREFFPICGNNFIAPDCARPTRSKMIPKYPAATTIGNQVTKQTAEWMYELQLPLSMHTA